MNQALKRGGNPASIAFRRYMALRPRPDQTRQEKKYNAETENEIKSREQVLKQARGAGKVVAREPHAPARKCRTGAKHNSRRG